MAYDEALAERIRMAVVALSGVTERKMFGGLAFLREGRMFCGIVQNDLAVRVGPDRYDEALGEKFVRPMDFTGRPMTGYVYVSPPGLRTDAALQAWVDAAARFVATLPPAGAGAKRPARRRALATKARGRRGPST